MSSFDNDYQKEIERVINVEFPWYINFIEDCFDFKQWGFQKIYSGAIPNTNPIIVYESNQCRVRFEWLVSTSYRDPEDMLILYGRLHAPIEQKIMDWNGEKRYCWHDVGLALSFLDGLTPQEARKPNSPVLMWDFYQATKDREWRRVELQARMQASLWIHYKQRLFNIFDLSHSDLWEQYAHYVKEYYSQFPIWTGNSKRPSLYQIC
jgi:hypothetical protein